MSADRPASLLRQIVAGPRARHPEAGLDLCYVTDNIIATSGPSSTYPQRAYRNPTDALVKFLDYKHGSDWAIWEFRAEGTGYPDSEVYNRIRHYPWPDHHPPPFKLIPLIMASMRDWLKGPESKTGRTVVVHCKAGKGRSGTIACSYLISEEGWTAEEALSRFTARRMRSGFGAGISIPSQQRWIKYVDWWAKHGKIYIDRPIEIVEVHIRGLRDGVKVCVEGFIDEGRTIQTFHTFGTDERTFMDSSHGVTSSSTIGGPSHTGVSESGRAAIFRPSRALILPTSDINIDFERRNHAAYGYTMVTSVAHVWFNTFFESQFSSTSDSSPSCPSLPSQPLTEPAALASSGVFNIQWDAMDGIRGSAKKGTRAFDELAVVWRSAEDSSESTTNIIPEPKTGHPIPDTGAADEPTTPQLNAKSARKDLGLRAISPNSARISRANSIRSARTMEGKDNASESDPEDMGIQSHGPNGESEIKHPDTATNTTPTPTPSISVSEPTTTPSTPSGTKPQPSVDLGLEKLRSPTPLHDPIVKSGADKGTYAGTESPSQEHWPGQIIRDH